MCDVAVFSSDPKSQYIFSRNTYMKKLIRTKNKSLTVRRNKSPRLRNNHMILLVEVIQGCMMGNDESLAIFENPIYSLFWNFCYMTAQQKLIRMEKYFM